LQGRPVGHNEVSPRRLPGKSGVVIKDY